MADGEHPETQASVGAQSAEITAVGIFLFLGAVMAALAGVTFTWPGTVLDRIWVLNASTYRQLAPLGRGIGILFLILSSALAMAGTGWARRRPWGWRLTVLIIAMQVLGGLANLIRGDFLHGGTGFAIAGGLLLYLLSVRVRASFGTGASSGER